MLWLLSSLLLVALGKPAASAALGQEPLNLPPTLGLVDPTPGSIGGISACTWGLIVKAFNLVLEQENGGGNCG